MRSRFASSSCRAKSSAMRFSSILTWSARKASRHTWIGTLQPRSLKAISCAAHSPISNPKVSWANFCNVASDLHVSFHLSALMRTLYVSAQLNRSPPSVSSCTEKASFASVEMGADGVSHDNKHRQQNRLIQKRTSARPMRPMASICSVAVIVRLWSVVIGQIPSWHWNFNTDRLRGSERRQDARRPVLAQATAAKGGGYAPHNTLGNRILLFKAHSYWLMILPFLVSLSSHLSLRECLLLVCQWRKCARPVRCADGPVLPARFGRGRRSWRSRASCSG